MMDQKMIELSNLRVLNDYLSQTVDALVRAQRNASPYAQQLTHAQLQGVAPFGGSPFSAGPFGVSADAIYGNGAAHWPHQGAAAQLSQLAGLYGLGAPVTPFTPAIDPFLGQRGMGYTPQAGIGAWPQASSPSVESARQAQLQQALIARQMVLEAMCRVAGISV